MHTANQLSWGSTSVLCWCTDLLFNAGSSSCASLMRVRQRSAVSVWVWPGFPVRRFSRARTTSSLSLFWHISMIISRSMRFLYENSEAFRLPTGTKFKRYRHRCFCNLNHKASVARMPKLVKLLFSHQNKAKIYVLNTLENNATGNLEWNGVFLLLLPVALQDRWDCEHPFHLNLPVICLCPETSVSGNSCPEVPSKLQCTQRHNWCFSNVFRETRKHCQIWRIELRKHKQE